MSSDSLRHLGDRLREVATLSGMDPARSGDTSRPDASNALARACIVLLSAHLEGYLEDLLVEVLDKFVSSRTLVERLPILLRALHAEKHLTELEPMTDRNRRAPRIQRMFDSEGPIWIAGNPVTSKMVNAKLVCEQMNNPGSKEIAAFLNLVGVDIAAHFRLHGGAATLGRVNGLVALRNQIAHGEAAAGATHRDVDDYAKLVSDLCAQIDIAVGASVRNICGMSVLPW